MPSNYPSIDGIPFRNALIIDDDPEEVEALRSDLTEKGINVISEADYLGAISTIKCRPEIDLVILDWFLNGDNSIQAEMIIDELKKTLLVPIVIYTNQGVDSPTRAITQKKVDRIAFALDKMDVTVDAVFQKIEEWFEINPELKIFLRWSWEVEKNMGPTQWTIYNLEAGGLKALIEIMKQPEDSSYVPREQDIVDLFGKVLKRKVNCNQEFFTSVKGHITELMEGDPVQVDDFVKLKAFHRFERYKPPLSESIWTGDIFRNEWDEYFVVVTPLCDLCQAKIENILLLKAELFDETYRKKENLGNAERARSNITQNKDSTHYLPYALDLDTGLICRFDRISPIKFKLLKDRMKSGKMRCIETIDSPFIENLMQRMNAYLMRLGVRELGNNEINKMLSGTNPK
jgi:CheY-like chemotaxis protein